MALDNFIGWSIADKLAMLRGVQEARATGRVVRVSTARGVETQFDPKQVNVSQFLRELESSIYFDPNLAAADPDGSIAKALAGNFRPQQTKPVFW